MKTKHQIISLLLLGAFAVSAASAQDYKFKGGYPTSAATKQALEDADYQRAITVSRPARHNQKILVFLDSGDATAGENAFHRNRRIPEAIQRVVRLFPHLRSGSTCLRWLMEARRF